MSEVLIQMAKTGSGRFGVPGMCGIKRLKQSCLTERLEKAVSAPCGSTCLRTFSSARAVMKTIGISCCRRVNCLVPDKRNQGARAVQTQGPVCRRKEDEAAFNCQAAQVSPSNSRTATLSRN
jgi:hypothetical protein